MKRRRRREFEVAEQKCEMPEAPTLYDPAASCAANNKIDC